MPLLDTIIAICSPTPYFNPPFLLTTLSTELLVLPWPFLLHPNRNSLSIASGVRPQQRVFGFAPVAHLDLKSPRHDPTSVLLLTHYPPPRNSMTFAPLKIALPRLPYQHPFLDQAPHPVRLRNMRESIV